MTDDKDVPPTTDQLLRRINTWLDTTEAAALDQARRRRLRSLLMYMIALGTVVALLDLLPNALTFVAPHHPPPGDLALRIVTTSVALAGGTLLVVEYLEPLALLLAEILSPVVVAAAVCTGSLSGLDLPGLPLLLGFVALGLLMSNAEVLRDIDAMRQTRVPWPFVPVGSARRVARRTIFGPRAMFDQWMGDRVARYLAAIAACVILGAWPVVLARHHGDSNAAAIWYGTALLPLAVVTFLTIAVFIEEGRRVLKRRRTRFTGHDY